MKFIPILFSTPMVQAIIEGRKTQTRREVKNHPANKYPNDECWHDTTVEFDTYFNEDAPSKKLGPTWLIKNTDGDIDGAIGNCPYGQVGDVLWVKETHYAFGEWKKNGTTKTGKQKWKFVKEKGTDILYTDNPPSVIRNPKFRGLGWYKRSSLFMPKEACRIFLKITNLRVERLQDISEEDAEKEGVSIVDFNCYENYLVDKDWYYNDMNQKGFHMIQDPVGSFASLWVKINGDQSWNNNPWVWVIEFKRIEKPENFK